MPETSLTLVLAVGAGGALGALGRYLAMSWIGHRLGAGFPYGTLFVNALGSFLLGAFLALSATVWQVPLELRLFFGVGILGAFTTFSTFAMDTAYLVGRRRPAAVGIYIVASVALSLAGAFLGYHLAQAAVA
jgi:CrcB protein